jgi:hypothetical protein
MPEGGRGKDPRTPRFAEMDCDVRTAAQADKNAPTPHRAYRV